MSSPLPDTPTPAMPAAPASSSGSVWRIWLGIVLAIVGMIVLGQRLNKALPQPPLPVLAQTTGDIELIERSGQKVKLSALRGKVTVMACLYTVCPHGCAAIVQQMQKLNEEHRAHPVFQQVSLAVAPDRDTASFLKSYADGIGVKPGDPWWFVTGEQQPIWDYLTKELKLDTPKPIPPEKRLNPLDFYEHDLRIVLLDPQGRVRGYYAVFHPQPEIATHMAEKLTRDVQRLLDDPSS